MSWPHCLTHVLVVLLLCPACMAQLGIEYGLYTDNAMAFNQDCTAVCDSGRRLILTNTTTRVHEDNMTSIVQALRDASMHYDADRLQQEVTRSWTSYTCQTCPDVGLPQHAYTFLHGSCEFVCNSPWVMRGSTCVECREETCSDGTYLSGDNCQICSPCSSRFVGTPSHSHFTGHGQLDDSDSCPEQCDDKHYEDIELQNEQIVSVCRNHTVPTCASNQFTQAGTHLHDAYCEDCITACNDMRMITTCSATAQAVCKPCVGTLQEGEKWSNGDCTRKCHDDYVYNSRLNICELCDFTCPIGFMTPINRHNCTHCEACPAIPHNATFVDACQWECDDQFELDNVTRTCQAIANSLFPIPLQAKTGRCDVGQRLTYQYICVNCEDDDDLVTPPPSQRGQTWQWLPSRSVCAWECLPGFYHYSINNNMHQCLELTSFLQKIDGGIAETSAIDHVTLTGTRRQLTTPAAMTEWQLVTIAVVVVVTVLYVLI